MEEQPLNTELGKTGQAPDDSGVRPGRITRKLGVVKLEKRVSAVLASMGRNEEADNDLGEMLKEARVKDLLTKYEER